MIDLLHYRWVESVEKPENQAPVDFKDYQQAVKLMLYYRHIVLLDGWKEDQIDRYTGD